MSWRGKWSWTVVALLVAAFLGLALLATTGHSQAFDTTITGIVHGAVNPRLTILMRLASAIATAAMVVLLVMVVVLFLQGRGRAALLILLSGIGGATLNIVLKLAFRREPPGPDLSPPVDWTSAPRSLLRQISNEYSFPSGHVVIVTIVFGLLAYLLGYGRPRPLRVCVACCALVLIALVGYSRVYLGTFHPPTSTNYYPRHYPTDVLGGFLMGGAWLISSISLCHDGAGVAGSSGHATGSDELLRVR